MADLDTLAPETAAATQVQSEVPKNDLFERWLQGDSSIALSSGTPTNIPDIRNVPGSPEGELVRPETAEMERYRQRNIAGDVPLNIREGGDNWERLVVGSIRAKEDQLAYLRNKYGQDKVRLSDDGEWIYRRKTPEGKVEDVLVDEKGISGGDFLDLLGELPELAVSIYSVRKGKLPAWLGGKLPLVKDAILAGAGYSVTGAAKDAAQRAYLERPIQPMEIATEAGKEFSLDSVLSMGAGAAGIPLRSAVNYLRNPFAVQSTLVGRESSKAIESLAKQTGITLPQTLAEKTQSKTLAAGERFLSNLPVAGEPIREAFEKRIVAERQVQDILLGKKQPATDEELSSRISTALKSLTEKVETDVTTATGEALKKSMAMAVAPLQTKVGHSYSALELGRILEQSADTKRQAFRSKAGELYDAVRAVPESTQPIFDTKPIKKTVNDLRSEIISKGKTVTETPGFLEDTGIETTFKTESGGGPLSSFFPEGTKRFLDDLSSLADKQDLESLRKARTLINDSIQDPQLLPNISTRWKTQLAKAFTQAIDEGTERLPSGELKKRLQAANKYYRENVPKFEQLGIETLLTPEQKGGGAREQFVASLFSGGKGAATTYNNLKDFFGKNSPEMASVRQYFFDTTLRDISNPVTKTVDFGSLLKRLDKMEPSIAFDLFRGKLARMETGARLGLVAEGRINLDELGKLVSSGDVTASGVNKLITAQEARDKLYRNSVLKAIGTGKLDAATFNPDKLLDTFVYSGKASNKDLTEVMTALGKSSDPELIKDVRRKYVANIFQKAARTTHGVADTANEDITRRLLSDSSRELDPQKFSLLFDSVDDKKRMEIILSPTQYETLRTYAIATGARAEKERLGGQAGTLVKGNILSDIFTGLKGLSDVAKYRFASFAITHPLLERLVLESRPKAELRNVMKFLALSPEFADALMEDEPEQVKREAIAADIAREFGK